MNINERKRKLTQAEQMAAKTLKRIRRLNTSLKNWDRRVKMHERALALEEKQLLERRIAELEGKVPVLRPRRSILMEGE